MKKVIFVFLFAAILAACSSEKKYTLEIAPPFKNVEVPVNKFEVNAGEDKVIRLKNGTSLSIPKDAFVDKNGNLIKGKVNIEYREFSKAADIIASGIPMVYEDENGEKQQMESAGMFEIRGKVNNEDVFIAKDKNISVNMASEVEGEYDFYYLEEEGKRQEAKAGLFVTDAKAEDTRENQRKVRWKKLTSLTDSDNEKEEQEQEQKNANARYFKLQFDTVKYPETISLKEVNFQIGLPDSSYNPSSKNNDWVLKENWEQLEIHKADLKPELLKTVPYTRKYVPYSEGSFRIKPISDSTGVILFNEKFGLYDFNGNKIVTYGDTSVYGVFVSPDCSTVLTFGKYIHDIPGNNEYKCSLFSKNGKLIRDLGIINVAEFLKTGECLVFDENENDLNRKYVLIDNHGDPIKTFEISHSTHYRFWNPIELSVDKSYFLTYSDKGISVFDHTGELQNFFPISEIVTSVQFIEYKDFVLLTFDNGNVKV